MRLEFRLLSVSVVLGGIGLCGCGGGTNDYSKMPPVAPLPDPTKDPAMQAAADSTKTTGNQAATGTGGAPPP